MKVKRAFFALALAIATGVVGASQLFANPTRSAATTIIVDQQTGSSTKQCNVTGGLAAYKTADAINNAIAVASPGDTIDVCPGTYNPVVVNKDKITITGTSVTATTSAQCLTPATYPATDPLKYAVVDGGGSAAAITADGVDAVKINSLTIQGGTSGVHTTGATNGLVVQTSVIQNNVMGVYLNGGVFDNGTITTSDDIPDKVKSNCIRRNNNDGSSAGSGIYSDQDLDSAKIQTNTFYKNNHSGDGGAVNLGAGTLTDIQITGNTSNSDANFVSATGSDGLNVNTNTVTGALGGAVWLDGDNADAQITANSFTNGHDDGIGLGDGGSASPNDHVLIFGNTITGNASDGIDTSTSDALTHSEIGNNTVSTNGDHGIGLFHNDNTHNFVTGNTVSGNGVVTADNCVDTDKALYHNTWFSNGASCKP
jgi:hypothetical protein